MACQTKKKGNKTQGQNQKERVCESERKMERAKEEVRERDSLLIIYSLPCQCKKEIEKGKRGRERKRREVETDDYKDREEKEGIEKDKKRERERGIEKERQRENEREADRESEFPHETIIICLRVFSKNRKKYI